MPRQAGNYGSKPKQGLFPKLKFLVVQLFIPMTSLYLAPFSAHYFQVAAQTYLLMVAIFKFYPLEFVTFGEEPKEIFKKFNSKFSFNLYKFFYYSVGTGADTVVRHDG